MDRETILRHSKAIRLEHRLLPDFTDIIAEFCTVKGHPEYTSALTQLLHNTMVRDQIINAILEYFEKEFHIIRVEKLPSPFGLNQKQLINII